MFNIAYFYEETAMDIIKGMVQDIVESSIKQKYAKRVRPDNRFGKKALRIFEVQTDVKVVASPI